MANLQNEFISFHDNIKLDDENLILREKRDILLDKLKDRINSSVPKYSHFCQGSYAMNTGIRPDDGDYDIDIGLKFELSTSEYPNPIEPKKWIRDALVGHTKSVEIKRSCVTVTYQINGEPAYHVDFAIYSADNPDCNLYLAKGEEHSKDENVFWEISNPQELIDSINEKHQGDDRAQFKRIIRCLKKWKNYNFDCSGSGAPTSIALTVLVYNFFFVNKTFDSISLKSVYDDLSALVSIVERIKNSFMYIYDVDSGTWCHTISINLPVRPQNDLFEKMTNVQMESFYNKLVSFHTALIDAKAQDKKSDACRLLVKQFGDEFPVTYEKSTVGTSESAY